MKTNNTNSNTDNAGKQGNYFWSGDCLMQNNENGTFSSSHILELGRIKPSEDQKAFIVTACNNHYALVEALKEIAYADVYDGKIKMDIFAQDKLRELLQSTC